MLAWNAAPIAARFDKFRLVAASSASFPTPGLASAPWLLCSSVAAPDLGGIRGLLMQCAKRSDPPRRVKARPSRDRKIADMKAHQRRLGVVISSEPNNRASDRNCAGNSVRPCMARSASTSPITGVNLNPCPLKPQATDTCG